MAIEGKIIPFFRYKSELVCMNPGPKGGKEHGSNSHSSGHGGNILSEIMVE